MWFTACAAVEPLPSEKIDYHFALIRAQIAAHAGGKNIKVDDFMPPWTKQFKEQSKWEIRRNTLRAMANGAFGKMPEDVRKKAFEKLDELERQEKEQNGET